MSLQTEEMADNFKILCSILLTAGLPYVMWIKEVATPIVVFIAALVGLIAGVYNLLNYRSKYLKNKREE
tara:strand:+ start:297 stop:503 length:207 start_codon:yes stop_codon:yes gene_type:complete